MSASDRRMQLFENVARLRRVSREAPGNDDLAIVRASLESELGATVSQRMSARVLGVSHTALQRWIARGDLPTVYGPNGQTEIPVPALLDLYDSVERERQRGQRRSHVLEPSMVESRRRASRLRPGMLVSGEHASHPSHRRAELRSLAYHRVLAKRLRRSMVDEARQTLRKWRAEEKIDSRYAEEWEQVLRLPVAEIQRVISEDGERARDLRQNSPFAGMLSEPERLRILQLIA